MNDITFISQNNNGIANDCGPAVWCMGANAMLGTRYRIQDVASFIQNEPNGVSSISRMVNGFRNKGVPTPDPVWMTKDQIKAKLKAGYFLILLTDRTTTGYKTNHYILLYGRPELGIVPVYDPYRDEGPVLFSLDEVCSWIIGPVICPAKPVVSFDKQRIIELVERL